MNQNGAKWPDSDRNAMASSFIKPLAPVNKTASVLKRRKKSAKRPDELSQKPEAEVEGSASEDATTETSGDDEVRKAPHIDTYA